MKALLLAATVLTAAVAVSRADLTIVQKIEGIGEDKESTSEFKGDKTRINSTPAISVIMDLKTGEMISLMHAQKSYVKIPSEMTRAALDSMKQPPGANGQKPRLAATGKTDTINGFASEEYTVTVGTNKTSLWLTKAIPDYDNALKQMSAAFSQGPMGAMMKAMGVDMTALPGFPIRSTTEISPGQVMTYTVLSVSTKPVADSEFTVPADYKETPMPGLHPPKAGPH